MNAHIKLSFSFLIVSESSQNKIVDEYTSLENAEVSRQNASEKSWTELLYSDFEHTAVIMIVF